MARRSQKKPKTRVKEEMVVIVFTEDMDQAKDYQVLLKNNDIPVILKEPDPSSEEPAGIAVMVPEDFIDEAHIIVESQDAYDDFYDFAFEDDDDFNGDLFGDEF